MDLYSFKCATEEIAAIASNTAEKEDSVICTQVVFDNGTWVLQVVSVSNHFIDEFTEDRAVCFRRQTVKAKMSSTKSHPKLVAKLVLTA